jgi:uncharacterized protein (DUF1015 family)
MKLSAFCGTRFDADPTTAGRRAAPPYDQIDPSLRDELHQQEYQFAHLSRPTPQDNDPHKTATEIYHSWQKRGVIQTDPSPAIYPYEIEMPDGRMRLGICGLISLESPESKIIRPHEETVAKTVDERLSLLRRMRVDIEPILLIADDGSGLNPILRADIASEPLLASHTDSFGAHHRLYKIDSQERIADYQTLLSTASGVIADGNHRYTVARRFAEETQPDPGSPAAMKLMVVTSLGSDGLSIDPIHRGLSQAIDLSKARTLAAHTSTISTSNSAEIVDRLASTDQPALVVGPIGDHLEVWQFEPRESPASLDDNLKALAVGWLHQGILPQLGFNPGADTDGTVVYRSDPDRLLVEIQSGQLSVGFWLPPMSGESFALATANGEILPPKSTRFLPKLVSGLVWAAHDCSVA